MKKLNSPWKPLAIFLIGVMAGGCASSRQSPDESQSALGKGRTQEEITGDVVRNMPYLKDAYSPVLQKHPRYRGAKLTARITVDYTGSVIGCEIVQGNTEEDELNQAIINGIMKWKFSRKTDSEAFSSFDLPVELE